MINDPVIAELVDLARRAPSPPGHELTGASEAEIKSLESEADRTLSPSFERWLKAVNGAMLGPGGLFGIRNAKDFLSIRQYWDIFPEWKSMGWIPVAGNGLGDYWVAVPRGPDGDPDWVAFINTHEDPLEVERFFASSVTRFVKFLLESELGERRWPADREYDLEHDPSLAATPEEKAPWSLH